MFLGLPDMHPDPLDRDTDPRVRIRIQIRTKFACYKEIYFLLLKPSSGNLFWLSISRLACDSKQLLQSGSVRQRYGSEGPDPHPDPYEICLLQRNYFLLLKPSSGNLFWLSISRLACDSKQLFGKPSVIFTRRENLAVTAKDNWD
jgi:hypothetical protein